MTLLSAIPAAFILLVFAPLSAHAHLVNTGLGPFYDGAMHLLMSPDDLLGVVGVVLLAGLCGAKAGRWTVMAMPLAWLIAGLVGLNLSIDIDLPWLSVLSMVMVGVLVAVNPTLPPNVVAALAGMSGALHGLLNGSALAAVKAGPLTIVGVSLTVLTVGLLGSAWIVSLKTAWALIAVRVGGSWVAAVGILMFGWLVRGSV
jgi:hydrogenase/urease accessory protein HupE